jgi:hypothetical protein
MPLPIANLWTIFPVIGINSLDMLQLWLMPYLQEDSKNLTVQQDKALPHFQLDVCAHFKVKLPGCWIGHASDNAMLLWKCDLP